MAQDKNAGQTVLYRNRRSFAKIPDVMDVPNLIAIQTDSFKWFMNEGLDQAFQDIAPIENNTKDMCVEFGDHKFGEPKYTVDECKEKDVSYQAPLFVEIRFINRETGEIKEIRMSPGIDVGDFNTKLKNAQKFLADGNRVKVSVRFRGREMAHTDIGRDLLKKFAELCSEVATLDKAAKLEGRNMSMFLSPKAGK